MMQLDEKSEGRALRVPNIVFSQGLVELAPPKETIPAALCGRNIAMCFDNTLAPVAERKHSRTI
jgi:hypothetical protein